MKFQQFYDLPEGEVPAGVVMVVASKSGQLYLVSGNNIDSTSVVAMLAGGIQIQVGKNSEEEKEVESRIVKPTGLTSIPLTKNGHSNN